MARCYAPPRGFACYETINTVVCLVFQKGAYQR